MPEGSSSAAPVMMPGPSDFNSDRIHRFLRGLGTNDWRDIPFVSYRSVNRARYVTSAGPECIPREGRPALNPWLNHEVVCQLEFQDRLRRYIEIPVASQTRDCGSSATTN